MQLPVGSARAYCLSYGLTDSRGWSSLIESLGNSSCTGTGAPLYMSQSCCELGFQLSQMNGFQCVQDNVWVCCWRQEESFMLLLAKACSQPGAPEMMQLQGQWQSHLLRCLPEQLLEQWQLQLGRFDPLAISYICMLQ